MKPSSIKFILGSLFLVLIATFALSQNQQNKNRKTEVSRVSTEIKTPEKTLLFFINPNGSPCQRQKALLEGVSDTLSKLAKLEYVSTLVPDNMEKFRAYGIRGLPMLIIVDAKGRELRRFTPGIQSPESVLEALGR